VLHNTAVRLRPHEMQTALGYLHPPEISCRVNCIVPFMRAGPGGASERKLQARTVSQLAILLAKNSRGLIETDCKRR
jgi:hypothetical protein